MSNFQIIKMTNDKNAKMYEAVDAEIYKTFYARDNNLKVVNFVLQEDPNLTCDLSSIRISFQVEIPANTLPENGFASKLFQNMNVELCSQLITSTKST